ncbi:uncharacterized protein LOC142768372 [Rhipicephalus microplus]|uniref:uncharacterized protein LOC142768372 n=1 Tax=Rhipicephalus microplus TaxID=6941 RepID=UPI003F6AA298
MNEISSSTAVAEIRTPIIVLPDVTSLRLISVGSNNFTAAWTKPKVNFDYYWIEVIGSNNDGTRVTLGTVGSCGDGTIIHRDLTHVTCTQLQPCSRVNFKVRTHINGPPARTSSGVSLYDILIPASVQPEVTNLKLGDVGTDTFALTWKRRSTCFDYYTVEVTDINSNRSSGVTCNNGTQISPIQTSVTCEQITTCSNVTIRVKTHTRGPPQRSGKGTVLRHVLLQGKAPPEPTNLKLVSAKGGNFTVTFKVQQECYNNWYWYRGYASKSSVQVLYNDICNFYRLDYNQKQLTCTVIQACDKLDLKIWTLRKGPPRHEETAFESDFDNSTAMESTVG